MKRLVLFFTIIPVLALTSCCRYRAISPCWNETVAVKKELEKKDLKKEQQ